MKYVLLFILIACQCWAAEAPDKVLHRSVMALSSVALYGALRARGNSIGLSMATTIFTGLTIGYLKEEYVDSFHDAGDMAANTEGMVLFCVVPLMEWSIK